MPMKPRPAQTFYEAKMTQWPQFAPDTSAHVINGLGEELYKKQRTQCFRLSTRGKLEQHLIQLGRFWQKLPLVIHIILG